MCDKKKVATNRPTEFWGCKYTASEKYTALEKEALGPIYLEILDIILNDFMNARIHPCILVNEDVASNF